MDQEKKSLPEKIESENEKEKSINLRDFKHGDKYLMRNGKTAVLWRQWYDAHNKNEFLVYGEIGKATIGNKMGIWNENGKYVYNDKKMELQNDPTMDLIERIEKHTK